MIVRWRRRAEQELARQIAHLRSLNPYAADRIEQRIKERISRLLHAPFTGRPSRKVGVREVVISETPFIAVYRVVDDRIEILRFFHAAQKR